MSAPRKRFNLDRPNYTRPRTPSFHVPPSRFGHQCDTPPNRGDIRLITNAYNIITANRDFTIHEYELDVQPSSGCKDLPSKVLMRAYVSRSIRQLLMRDIIPSLTEPNSFSGSIIIEPNLDAIYSLQPLLVQKNNQASTSSRPNQDEYIFNNIAVSTDLISQLRVDITIKHSRILKLNPATYTTDLLGSVIHHQLMIQMMKYGSVYYTIDDLSIRPSERLDLISRHLLGISISGVRKSLNSETLVVINCSHSYITQSHRIIDLLASFVAGRSVFPVELLHNLNTPYERLCRSKIPEIASVRGTEEWFASFCCILNGFKCHAIGSSGSEVNLRFSLTDMPASGVYFEDGTSVIDYYKSLGVLINYPNLPCLISRSTKHAFYPMEMCSLLPGQKVPIFRLSTAARAHLVLMNKPQPHISRNTSLKARDQVAAVSRSQLDAFGLQLSRDPVEAIGCTLNKPTLEYRDKTIYPNRDFWESGQFYESIELVDNWCVLDTVGMDKNSLMSFIGQFSSFSVRFGLRMGPPKFLFKSKQDLLERDDSIETLIRRCSRMTQRELRFILFIIDSTSTQLNRMIHLAFDEHPHVSATCLRSESVMNQRQHRSIFRTLVHKLNTRLGGTNLVYNRETWHALNLDSNEIMVVGLDVTHPDNELSGVSIVGCAYTHCRDLFRHRSLVWPQTARKEIIAKMGPLMERLLEEYRSENAGRLPRQIIVYRDGVSHEEFERVRVHEIAKASKVIDDISHSTNHAKPRLSYIIAQKRHTMRFYQVSHGDNVQNPPGGTLINRGVMPQEDKEFYLYSNTSPQATARPLHYHVLVNGMGLDNLQKITYYLCFNFGKCSSSLSMPSSLRYAHNAAYDARNRVIASREFSENKFYTTKFFC